MTAAYQAPPSVGFSRQEYWSGGAIAFSNIQDSVTKKTKKKKRQKYNLKHLEE